ncbi:MAG: hypothetical protein GWO20_16185 [Candidatus Korarchaeota archaeon]|nr:hypothetical protein [Candidatus Korarchaeota archaeon]
MQKRIDRQTAALRSAEEKLRLAEQRIEEINKSSPVQEDKAPNMDDYDTVEEYTEAMAEYRADKIVKDKLKAEREAELQKAQQAKFEQMTKSFEEREASFRAENPEYKSNQENFEYNFNMINSQGKTPATQTIAQVLMERNSAPALINELGRNEDLLHELSSMSPVEAVFKLAELERDISSRKKVKREEVPPPVKSVNGTGKGKKSVSNMNVDEAMKWFNS